MKSGYTHIAIVLDRSGSMSSCVNDTIGGFNTFIDEQKKVPGEASLTLVQFDDEYLPIHSGIALKDVPPLVFVLSVAVCFHWCEPRRDRDGCGNGNQRNVGADDE